jgi:LytR cell envelope-related transcriptional attenuator
MTFLKGLSRPVRLAGVVLIAIAVVAVVIGTVSAVNGGSTETAAPTPAGAPSSTGNAPPPAPSSASLPPSGNGATSPAGPPVQPPAGTSAPTSPDSGQLDAKWVAVRVYNNSTIKGLAARAANDFRGDGWNITESGNYPYGIIQHSTAYFTPGTDEETAAKALAADFHLQAEPRFEGIQDSSPGVIVIVTNDYQGKGKD